MLRFRFNTQEGKCPNLVAEVAAANAAGVGDLKAGDGLEVHHLQHVLGLGVDLDDVLLKSGHVGHVVVPSLALLLLQLDRDAADGRPLEPLHQVGDKAGDLVPQGLGGDEGNLLDDPLVRVEVEGQLCVVSASKAKNFIKWRS